MDYLDVYSNALKEKLELNAIELILSSLKELRLHFNPIGNVASLAVSTLVLAVLRSFLSVCLILPFTSPRPHVPTPSRPQALPGKRTSTGWCYVLPIRNIIRHIQGIKIWSFPAYKLYLYYL